MIITYIDNIPMIQTWSIHPWSMVINPYIDGSWIDNQPPQWPWLWWKTQYLSVPSREAGRTGAHGQVHHIRPDTRVLRFATKGATNSRLLLDSYNLLYSYPKNCRYQGVNNLGQHPFSQDWLIWLPEFDPDWTILKLVGSLLPWPRRGQHFAAHFFTRPLQTGNPSP